MIFKNVCVFVLWTKIASALEGLKLTTTSMHYSSEIHLRLFKEGCFTRSQSLAHRLLQNVQIRILNIKYNYEDNYKIS